MRKRKGGIFKDEELWKSIKFIFFALWWNFGSSNISITKTESEKTVLNILIIETLL